MHTTSLFRLPALVLAGAILHSPAFATTQGQTAGQSSTQPAPPAGGSMPAGGMMDKHGAMPGMAGTPMQDDKMPAAMPAMADKGGCCGMKMKPMAKPVAKPMTKPATTPHPQAKPATAKPAPKPADKPMPMQHKM